MKDFAIEYLKRLNINPDVINHYDEPHRFYHNWEHIDDLIQRAKAEGCLTQSLMLAIIFHDIVYNPKEMDKNEAKSMVLFRGLCSGIPDEMDIANAILDTKNHKPSVVNKISIDLCRLDMAILDSDFKGLIEYENKIFKEFQFADWKDYKRERVKALRQLQKNQELENLISYVEARQPNIAVYAGSFNPFHKGHLNILKKAESIFDKVIIARGYNPDKISQTVDFPDSIGFRQTEIYKGLLTDFINELGYDVTLIRGLRNATDLQYEVTQLRFMQDMKRDLKVVSLVCDKEFEHISSSAIRQLKQFGKGQEYLVC